jgi:hypothetical protein
MDEPVNNDAAPAENLVVKKVKKKRTYTPEQRQRMLNNLEKARACARTTKQKNKAFRDKKKMVEKIKRDKKKRAAEQLIDDEYNEVLGTNQKISMEVEEDSTSEEEAPPPRRRRRKKRIKKPRRAKKKVQYYYEPDDSESSSEEWAEEPVRHRSTNRPREPKRDEILEQHYQQQMGRIAHNVAPRRPELTTQIAGAMIFGDNPFGSN